MKLFTYTKVTVSIKIKVKQILCGDGLPAFGYWLKID